MRAGAEARGQVEPAVPTHPGDGGVGLGHGDGARLAPQGGDEQGGVGEHDVALAKGARGPGDRFRRRFPGTRPAPGREGVSHFPK